MNPQIAAIIQMMLAGQGQQQIPNAQAATAMQPMRQQSNVPQPQQAQPTPQPTGPQAPGLGDAAGGAAAMAGGMHPALVMAQMLMPYIMQHFNKQQQFSAPAQVITQPR